MNQSGELSTIYAYASWDEMNDVDGCGYFFGGPALIGFGAREIPLTFCSIRDVYLTCGVVYNFQYPPAAGVPTGPDRIILAGGWLPQFASDPYAIKSVDLTEEILQQLCNGDEIELPDVLQVGPGCDTTNIAVTIQLVYP
ncbi:hypothetical protein [Aeoliella sp.]|uniref:hypothetical protein n=1 Tax=Aeoliella sp. TaxID=2795800 RepID=UPI003CCC3733